MILNTNLDGIEYEMRKHGLFYRPDPETIVRATHESGHAIAALGVHVAVSLVSVRPVGRLRGRCEYELASSPPTDERARRLWAFRRLVVTYGPEFAEANVDGALRSRGFVHST